MADTFPTSLNCFAPVQDGPFLLLGPPGSSNADARRCTSDRSQGTFTPGQLEGLVKCP